MTVPIPYMTLFKIFGPIILIAGLFFGSKWALSNAYDDGADSRDEEVATLTASIETANADIETLSEDLSRCRGSKSILENDLQNANKRVIAMADENARALQLQSQQFAAAQSNTARALDTLARNTQSADLDFAAILEQLKGVEYDVDQNTGRCIIRGGGNILQDAARGRIRN